LQTSLFTFIMASVSTYSVVPSQQNTVAETPVNFNPAAETPSVNFPNVDFDPTVYSSNDVLYQWDSDDAQAYSSPNTGLEGSFKAIGLALGGIVPVVIVVVVIAIIIAIVLEMKRTNTFLTIKGREANPQAPSWLDSIVSSFNDVESERLMSRMFPGGFHDVIDSIEGVYRRYRGLHVADDVKEN